MPECTYINNILNMPRVLNMPIFWTWESSEYGRVLNMWALHSVLNMPEYATILNMTGFWICKSYAGCQICHNIAECLKMAKVCLNMSEFMIIDRVLNILHAIHSARSLYKFMSTYWEIKSKIRTRSKI